MFNYTITFKSTLFFSMLCLCSLFMEGVNAQSAQGISFFKGTYQEALQKAKTENKLVFMDCYTSWCVPCKKLAAEVFPKKEMGDYFNANFISIQMDMEKGIGIDLSKRFGVTAFPTLLLLNPEGYKVGSIVGYWEAKELLEWAAKAKLSSTQLTVEMRFDQGDRSPVFIKSYFSKLIKDGQIAKAREDFAAILSKEGMKSLLQEKYYDLIGLTNIDSPAVQYLVNNREEFAKAFTADSVDAKIRQLYISVKPLSKVFSGRMGGYKSDAHDKLKAIIMAAEVPDKKFLLGELEVFVSGVTNRPEEGIVIAEKLLEGAPAWKYYELALLVNWNFQPKFKTNVKSWVEKALKLSEEGPLKTHAANFLNDLNSGKDVMSYIPTVEVLGRKFYGL